jgi:hypothetical protein
MALCNAAGTTLVLHPANLAANTHAVAQYFTFTVTVNATNVYMGCQADAMAAQLSTRCWAVGIDLPTEVNAARDTILHHSIDSPQLLNPGFLLGLLENLNAMPPVVGYAAHLAGAFNIVIDDTAFHKDFMEFYHECCFHILKV